MLEIEKNYRLHRRAYQSLLVGIPDIFIQYIYSLEPDEIKQLDEDIKANRWEVESIVDIKTSFELLHIFQLFYYCNGRLSLPMDFYQFLMEKPLQAPKNITKKALCMTFLKIQNPMDLFLYSFYLH